MERKKIIYDGEEDILFLSKRKNVKSSIDIGDFVLDLDSDGFIVGIEIFDASKNLNINENLLKNIKDVSLSVTYKPNMTYVYLVIKLKNKEKNITIPITNNLMNDANNLRNLENELIL